MFGVVLAAFVGTGLTGVGAKAADFFGFIGAKAHQLGGGVAQGGAFHIQLNAAGHHFDVFFLQAGGSTMVANGGTGEAGINAGFVLVIGFVFHAGISGKIMPDSSMNATVTTMPTLNNFYFY